MADTAPQTASRKLTALRITANWSDQFPCDAEAESFTVKFDDLPSLTNAIESVILDAEREMVAEAARFTPTHRHYKGSLYQVLHRDALHTETEEPMVVYRNEAGRVFARPQAMFDDNVSISRGEGAALIECPRFAALRATGHLEEPKK